MKCIIKDVFKTEDRKEREKKVLNIIKRQIKKEN